MVLSSGSPIICPSGRLGEGLIPRGPGNLVEDVLCPVVRVEHSDWYFTVVRDDAMDHPGVLGKLENIAVDRSALLHEFSKDLELAV